MTGTGMLTIGTSAEGSVGNAAGRAVARLFSAKCGLAVEACPTAGQSVLLPQVNDGVLDMGIANVLEVAEALRGDGVFAGRRQTNLRALCVLFPNRTGLFVRARSGIRSIADLKGKRISWGFSSMTSMNRLVLAILANGGLSLDDVTPVQVANANGGIDGLIEGKLDAFYSAPGAGRVAEAARQTGGLRMLPLSIDAAAVTAMQAIVPESFAYETPPQTGLTGIDETIHTLSYDLPLLVGAHVADDAVHRIAAVMAEHGAGLADVLGDFSAFRVNAMPRSIPCDYHPGAIRFYRERGIRPQT